MSKYDPLRRHLEGQSANEHPMTFSDVERVLGFPLPPSARAYPAWWSNNEATNVAVSAWRRAGRRTARVDVPGERVVFVSERPAEPASPFASRPGAAEPAMVMLTLDALPAHVRNGVLREGGGEAGVLRLLELGVAERKRRLLEELRALSPPTSGSSVELIREDRDAR